MVTEFQRCVNQKLNKLNTFIKEPENERFKYINGKHLSLALQGGGCKGVQYVGAYSSDFVSQN
jgi:Fe-S cluster assembly iron-binding protein IscA